MRLTNYYIIIIVIIIIVIIIIIIKNCICASFCPLFNVLMKEEEEDFARSVVRELIPLWHFESARVNPVKLADVPRRPDGRPHSRPAPLID